MKRLCAGPVLAGILVAGGARADMMTVQKLLEYCNSSDPHWGTFCTGYIGGLADMMFLNGSALEVLAPQAASPSYSPNLDDFRAWATLFGGTRGPRRRTRSGSALMFLFGWQALGVTKQGWDAAARGSGTSGRKAASEQFEETGVGAGRWQPDANAGLSFDHAGGDLEQAQA